MTIPKPEQRAMTTSVAKPKTAKQIAAAEAKAAKALARETRQKESDDRFTAPQMIRAVVGSFGRINFDPCWHPASAVRPDAYLDVRQGHNGLRDDWSGPLAFVNPPWSAQDRWLRRAHDQWLKGHVATVVCLVPAKTDARFFHHVLSRQADVYFLEGRPRFAKIDGSSEPTMVSTMVVMFGATLEQTRRFAAQVPGSWLMPPRTRSARVEPARGRRRDPIRCHGPVSCTAPDHHVPRTVYCGSSPASFDLANHCR